MGYLIGVDIGGTFTDCAILDQDGRIHTGKAPTTPHNPVHGCFAEARDGRAQARDREGPRFLRGSRRISNEQFALWRDPGAV